MSHLVNLPEQLQQRLRAELRPMETVLWAGQPLPSRYMRREWKKWLFFIPWTGFILFWIWGAAGSRVPSFDSGFDVFPLFGLPFLIIGASGLLSPLWQAYKARSIVYAVTNQRAIEINGFRSIKVTTYFVNDFSAIERTEYPDGSGDLVLRKERPEENVRGQGRTDQGFFAIPDVRQAGQLLHNLLQARRA